ncbi:MAG: hypothetical protein ISP90_13985 [Nevskia sp.]|nr:hypothetical protein [Nevskia sp.]
MLKKLLLAAIVLASASAEARHRAVPLKDPPPLTVPLGVAEADVARAIIFAGATRQWKVTDRKPGDIVLEYAPREFSVTVDVKYDAHTVNISYVGSKNMEYEQENGMAVIHPNYNRWVNNLAHDIDSQLTISSVK